MNYFSSTLGLVTKNDPTTENGGSFFAYYLVFKDMLNLGFTELDLELFKSKMYLAYVGKGLYLRSEHHKTRTVSHDEITSFMISSSILQTFHGKEIYSYLKANHGNYPATGIPKHYNPGSFYAWAVLAGEGGFFKAVWYTLNLLISSNKPKQNTSSKLTYLAELYVMQKTSTYSKLLNKYFTWRMEAMYGKKWIQCLYDIYFSMEDTAHPLRDLSSRV